MMSIRYFLGWLVLSMAVPLAGVAQVVPDETLGAENSRVRRALIGGDPADLIEGGATRGRNLFHSFREFGVREGDAAYFANPAAIQNIFGRVTGSSPSNILGTLGVTGRANLFLMNPNGILFGPNASLDLGGSFAATTANALQFGELGFFSATNPELPSALLTINPSAFLFSQVNTDNPATITNRATTGVQLQVNGRQNLLLLGGNIINDGGYLSAYGGRIDVGAVAGVGAVGLNPDHSFNFPTSIVRGDISFTNGSVIDVSSDANGSITVTGRDISLAGGSSLIAGIFDGLGRLGSQAGDLTLNATGDIRVNGRSAIQNNIGQDAIGNAGGLQILARALFVEGGSQIQASASGSGNAGNITINATDRVVLDGSVAGAASSVFSTMSRPQGSSGKPGSIQINTPDLALSGGAQIAGSTLGQGDASNVEVNAASVTLEGNSGILSNVERGALGNGGDVRITANSLSLSSGSSLGASTRGAGNTGSVIVNVFDRVLLVGATTGISANVEKTGVGEGGNIFISSRLLNLGDGAQLTASTSGNGNAGDITIRGTTTVTLDGRSAIIARIEQTGTGRAGNIAIDAGTLFIRNGARLLATTPNEGNAGNIVIRTNQLSVQAGGSINSSTSGGGQGGDIRIERRDSGVTGSIEIIGISPSAALPVASNLNASTSGTGRSGDIVINTDLVAILNGGQVSAATTGAGRAGNITIEAEDVKLSGLSSGGDPSSLGTPSSPSSGETAQAGNITINTNRLSLRDAASLNSSASRGEGGTVEINARDEVEIIGTGNTRFGLSPSLIITSADSDAVRAGNVLIRTGRLSLQAGGAILANSFNSGRAGDIQVEADSITLTGTASLSQGITRSGLTTETAGSGRAGDIRLNARELSVLDGAEITARTSGQGNAGNITVRNAETVSLDNGTISTEVAAQSAVGRGGDIKINTTELNLNQGRISSSTSGRGDTGSITVQANRGINLVNNSLIASEVRQGATGNSQNIMLGAPILTLQQNSQVSAATAGNGRAGNITIRGAAENKPANSISLNNSDISTAVGNSSVGQGGNIEIQTGRLNLQNRSNITSSTAGIGNTGRIAIIATEGINLRNSRITNRVEADATGDSGTIRLDTPQLNLTNSRISAATNGNGSAGNIIVPEANSVRLNNSTLSTQIRNRGIVPRSPNSRGNIRLNTRNLNLTNRSRITANTANQGNAGNINVQNAEQITASNSSISSTVQPNASGQGGNINLDTAALNLDNAQVSASSSGRGNAGNIQVQNADRISVDQGRISTAVTSSNSGRGGNINLETGRLDLDNAQISATTVSRRPAGSISLNATGNITATNSQIVTSSQQSSGGSIDLAADQVRLSNSDIQTDLQSGTAAGGNIAVNANAVIARGDSDIISAAPEGSGGDITLPLFFGEGYQVNLSEQEALESLNGNGRVDINANGQLSSGAVQTPDTSQIQNSLADLPNSAIDTEALLANSCIARTESGGTFLVTGSGGLPTNRPGTAPLSPYPTDTVRSRSDTGWQLGDPIVEPQGVFQLPNGELVIMHECQR